MKKLCLIGLFALMSIQVVAQEEERIIITAIKLEVDQIVLNDKLV